MPRLFALNDRAYSGDACVLGFEEPAICLRLQSPYQRPAEGRRRAAGNELQDARKFYDA
jgi:hypothetical protein